MTLAPALIADAADAAAARPRHVGPRLADVSDPAYLAGASRQFRKKYRRWMRKRRRDDITYVPPRGVSLDAHGDPVYDLSGAQADVNESASRFRVLIAGRRFGKTHLACVELLTAALEKPGALCWYLAPTYRMAKDIAWDTLKAMLPPWLLARKPNESTLTVVLVNGSKIALKGAEHWDRLRGRGLWFVVPDEFPMMDRRVWDEAIRPSLAAERGRALFIGTPMGFNWGYDLHAAGLGAADGAEWKAWTFTTEQGGRVSAAELDAARSEMDPRLYRQEFLASFETLKGRVYDNFSRRTVGASPDTPSGTVDPAIALPATGPIFVGLDFNINPMTAVLAVKAADELLVFDCLEVQTSNTSEVAAEIRRRYPTRQLVACPDPSGKARKTSAAAGETDFTILEREGFRILADDAAPYVKDRINAVQALLLSADGRRRLRIHPKAAALLKALDGLTYKEGMNVPDPKSPHIHITDALGYLVWQVCNPLVSRVWRTSHFAL